MLLPFIGNVDVLELKVSDTSAKLCDMKLKAFCTLGSKSTGFCV